MNERNLCCHNCELLRQTGFVTFSTKNQQLIYSRKQSMSIKLEHYGRHKEETDTGNVNEIKYCMIRAFIWHRINLLIQKNDTDIEVGLVGIKVGIDEY